MVWGMSGMAPSDPPDWLRLSFKWSYATRTSCHTCLELCGMAPNMTHGMAHAIHRMSALTDWAPSFVTAQRRLA
eukprot:365925-Chlamydomonas_euryale.AAC.5